MGDSHRFRGKLLIAGADDQALVVDLRVQEGSLIITTGGESLGVWPVEQVFVERVVGDRFNLTLDGEDSVFLADDALSFSYEALPEIEHEAALLRDKRRLRRKRDKSVKKLLSAPHKAKRTEPAPPTTVEPAKSEPRARANPPAPSPPLAADPFDGWLPEPKPTARPKRAKAPVPATEGPPAPVRREASKRAPIEVITSEPVREEVSKAKPVQKKTAPAAKRPVPAEPTTLEVATEFRQRPRPQPKPEKVAAPEAAPARQAAKGSAPDAALLELKAPSARSRSKKGAAAVQAPPPAPAPVEPTAPPPEPTGAPVVARAGAPATRAWKKMATAASSTAIESGPSPSAESTSRPAKLRKNGGSGFARQMEPVEPEQAPQEAEPTSGRRPWKRAVSGGPLVAPPPGAEAEETGVEVDLDSSPAADQPDPFAAQELVGTAPVANPYGIRSRPTGLSARLRRRQEPEPHDHQYVQQNVGAGLVRRVCEVCGHVSLDLTEGEAAGA